MEVKKQYIAIDLKSFYASVECVDRGLDPLNAYLVVADEARTSKTICLAVSPALKAHGIPGRPRLFEVEQRVREINAERAMEAPGGALRGETAAMRLLKQRKDLGLRYFVAKPRMARYIEISKQIYGIYIKYISPEDIHVYSIDEVFIDATPYLKTYSMTARELAMQLVGDVLAATGITATVGIGTNMYLAKVAMDIVAKHIEADSDGVRLAQLDEMSYRKLLWGHTPITDFWRVGRGYKKKLSDVGLHTMGDIARCSIGLKKDFHNEDLLYKIFGVNAELLIDHAWGWEPCTIKDIKDYTPSSNSVCSGQVLQEAYDFNSGRIVVSEMADELSLDLLSKGLSTDQIVLTVGYDIENLSDPIRRRNYTGEVVRDAYGRLIPKHAHGTANLGVYTSSNNRIVKNTLKLYDKIVGRDMLIRRINISANRVVEAETGQSINKEKKTCGYQLSLFDNFIMDKDRVGNDDFRYGNRETHSKNDNQKAAEEPKGADKDSSDSEVYSEVEASERRIQETLLNIKGKFGKNAILKGISYREGATARDRNKQIGGHKA